MDDLPMDNSLVAEQLLVLGEGIHKCGWFGGWIEVECKPKHWGVLWRNGKTSHELSCNPMIYVAFYKDHIGYVAKSAISMWSVRDSVDKIHWAEWMKKKIKKAVQ